MNDFEKIIFKFWFKNGTYIEKEIHIDENVTQKDIDKLNNDLKFINEKISFCFKDDAKANFKIESLIIRCSELIAFDAIPVMRNNNEMEE